MFTSLHPNNKYRGLVRRRIQHRNNSNATVPVKKRRSIIPTTNINRYKVPKIKTRGFDQSMPFFNVHTAGKQCRSDHLAWYAAEMFRENEVDYVFTASKKHSLRDGVKHSNTGMLLMKHSAKQKDAHVLLLCSSQSQGKELLQHMETFARDQLGCRTTSLDSVFTAIPFYLKLGYLPDEGKDPCERVGTPRIPPHNQKNKDALYSLSKCIL
jgi:hypothetical protein